MQQLLRSKQANTIGIYYALVHHRLLHFFLVYIPTILLGAAGLGIVGLHQGGQGLVGLGLGPAVAGDGKRGGLAGEQTRDGIDVADIDLDGSVIAGRQEAVGPAALAGDVEVDVVTVLVLHGCCIVGCVVCIWFCVVRIEITMNKDETNKLSKRIDID